MRFLVFALFLCTHLVESAVYSVGVYSADGKIINAGSTFASVPNAHQIADVYARLSGAAPLLWEGVL
jgi:hypothetical protein